jgi:hypothetical protein
MRVPFIRNEDWGGTEEREKAMYCKIHTRASERPRNALRFCGATEVRNDGLHHRCADLHQGWVGTTGVNAPNRVPMAFRCFGG